MIHGLSTFSRSPRAGGPCVRLAFQDWFGLTRAAAEVLAVLYEAQGAALQAPDIARAAGVSPGAVGFHLVFVRRALECEGLDHAPGEGYRLSEVGLQECREVLHALGEELRRA